MLLIFVLLTTVTFVIDFRLLSAGNLDKHNKSIRETYIVKDTHKKISISAEEVDEDEEDTFSLNSFNWSIEELNIINFNNSISRSEPDFEQLLDDAYREELKVIRESLTNSNKNQSKVLKKADFKKDLFLSDFRTWLQYYHILIYTEGVPVLSQNDVHYISRTGGERLRFEGYNYVLPNISTWCKNKTLWKREGRFPSVQYRIQHYMGSWYNFTPSSYLFDSDYLSKLDNITKYHDLINIKTVFKTPLLFRPKDLGPKFLYERSQDSRIHYNCKFYLINLIDIALLHKNHTTPVFFKVGDTPSPVTKEVNVSYPVFGKVRDLKAEASPNQARYLPTKLNPHCPHVFCGVKHRNILWPCNQPRHFTPVSRVPPLDIPFNEKAGKLVYRASTLFDIWKERVPLPLEIDTAEQRLQAVKLHMDSELVDAKFHSDCGIDSKHPRQFCGKSLSQKELLQYKYLLSIEGNDVSSGLKWMLFSNSVVFLPPITYESWAMETLLKPFVHYIPVFANMTNLEKMVRWAEAHPRQCKRIAQMSTLFIYDLLFHPQAYIDDELIKIGIMNKYEENFKCRSTNC